MMKTDRRPLALGLTVLGAVARLLPHAPNFTPVGGMSLFAGAKLKGWQAFLLPLVLMLVTDPLVGGYSRATPFVYAAFLINVWIGRKLVTTQSVSRIGAACVLGSLQFFLITNFSMFLTLYSHDLAGLAQCYALALPFYGRTLLADLFYTGALFGMHAWLSHKLQIESPVAA